MADIGEKYFPCPVKGWCVMCRRLKVRFPVDEGEPYFWCPKQGYHAKPSDVFEDCDAFVYMIDDERECQNCVHFKLDKYCAYNSRCMSLNRYVAPHDYVCEGYEEKKTTETFENEKQES